MTENNPAGLSLEEAAGLLVEAPEEDKPETEEPTDDATETDEAEDVSEEVGDDQPEDDADEDEEEEVEDSDPEIEWETAAGDAFKVALSELQHGYIRHQDYTRKTQEVSEARKSLEGEQAQVAERLKQLDDQLAQWAINEPQEPDWASLAQQMDPNQFNLTKIQYDQRKAQQEQARSQFEQLRQEEAKRLRDEGAKKLQEALPVLSDPVKGQEAAADIMAAADQFGISQEELNEIHDHRVYMVLHMAAQHLKSQTEAKETAEVVQKKVSKVPKALKPGGTQTTKRQRAEKQRADAMNRLKKSGSLQDAASLLLMG